MLLGLKVEQGAGTRNTRGSVEMSFIGVGGTFLISFVAFVHH
jgi:hypothetical protein